MDSCWDCTALRWSGRSKPEGQHLAKISRVKVLSLTHNLAGRTAKGGLQLWIADGDQPAPLQAVLTYKDVAGQCKTKRTCVFHKGWPGKMET